MVFRQILKQTLISNIMLGSNLEKLTKLQDNTNYQFTHLVNRFFHAAPVDTPQSVLKLAFELSTVLEEELRRYRPTTNYVTLAKNGNQVCPAQARYANPTFQIYQTWGRWPFLSRRGQPPLLTYQLLESQETDRASVMIQYHLLAAKFAAEEVQERRTPKGLIIQEIKECG